MARVFRRRRNGRTAGLHVQTPQGFGSHVSGVGLTDLGHQQMPTNSVGNYLGPFINTVCRHGIGQARVAFGEAPCHLGPLADKQIWYGW